jgi:hypothetical protein
MHFLIKFFRYADIRPIRGRIAANFREKQPKIAKNSAKMAENRENGAKMAENGAKMTEQQSKMAENESKMAENGENEPKIEENEPKIGEIVPKMAEREHFKSAFVCEFLVIFQFFAVFLAFFLLF